jgi:glycosyltransferase involved in cell wall biosynthesis
LVKVKLVLSTYLYGQLNAHDPVAVQAEISYFVSSLPWDGDRGDLGSIKKKSIDPSLVPLSKIGVVAAELPTSDMPRLYLAADAFVLPTRGEGWGLPYVEVHQPVQQL